MATLGEKTIIQQVYEKVSLSVENVWVATDDERIANSVLQFGGKVVMTRNDHQSGTDRCAEAADKISKEMTFDAIINIQGDEPFVRAEQIEALKSCFDDPKTEIATLIKQIDNKDVLFNPNRPKVVIDNQNNALLFSRSTIPFIRESEPDNWLNKHQFYSHLGMYAYRTHILPKITKLPPSSLELAESLEQLRWLENGYCIKTAITEFESIGIDTPEDLETAKQFILNKK